MPKNGQDDLKFGQNMYYDHFIDFENFVKICQKMVIFWQKKNNFIFSL